MYMSTRDDIPRSALFNNFNAFFVQLVNLIAILATKTKIDR